MAKTATKKRPTKPKRRRTLTAAATQLKFGDQYLQKLRRTRRPWQEQAWIYYDDVGEVKYAMNYLSHTISKAQIFAAEIDDPNEDPVQSENEIAVEEMDRLELGDGKAELLSKLSINLSVPGDCYLVGLAETDLAPETWSVRSLDEIDFRSGLVQIRNADGTLIPLDTENDYWARLWIPHPRKTQEADSSLRGVLGTCEEILMIERAVRAVLRSRAATAGILLMDRNLSFGPPDPTQDPGDGEAPTDPFVNDLMDAMEAPIKEPESASAVIPIIVRGEKEQLAATKLITLDRSLDPLIDKRMDMAIQRLAQGLNVPVQVVTGVADVNHWSAWQITEDAFNAHIEPLLVAICEMLADGFLKPMLKARGIDPSAFTVWYDATKLIVRPDRGQDAQWAYGADLISDQAARAALAFDDDDAPTDDELQKRLVTKGTRMDPTVQAQLLRDTIAPNIQVPEPQAGFAPPKGSSVSPTETPSVAPTKGPPPAIAAAGRAHLGARLAEIDRNLRQKLHVAADAAMGRTLERAGAKLLSRAKKDQTMKAMLQGVESSGVAKALGPSLIARLGVTESDLVDNGFATLKRKFMLWTSQAQQQALDAIDASEEDIALVQDQQAQDRTDAWVFLAAALTSLAHQALYDPVQNLQAGEFDSEMSVPYGLIRGSVSMAGGAQGVEETPSFAVLVPGGDPAGGIGTGQVIGDLLAQNGQGIEGYEWVYGAYPRATFEPHLNLDTTFFTDWSDEVLANQENWPETEFYYPGDHDGCQCDFVPTISDVSEAATVSEG